MSFSVLYLNFFRTGSESSDDMYIIVHKAPIKGGSQDSTSKKAVVIC